MKMIPTTAEVYRALMSAHWQNGEMIVWGSCTEPDQGFIQTIYSLKNADYPLIRAESTWDYKDGYKTSDEREHKYWLYVLEKDDVEWN